MKLTRIEKITKLIGYLNGKGRFSTDSGFLLIDGKLNKRVWVENPIDFDGKYINSVVEADDEISDWTMNRIEKQYTDYMLKEESIREIELKREKYLKEIYGKKD